MTGPPDRDGYRNVQVCLLCVVDTPEYDEMFPVGRIYRTATKEDMLKLFSKFGAETTEADTLKLGSFHSWSFEQQKLKSETIALNRATEAAKRSMDFNLRSAVFKARLKAGCV